MLTFSSSRSSLKKKVALLAWSEAWDSCSGSPSLLVALAARIGVALSFLMSLQKPSVSCRVFNASSLRCYTFLSAL